MALNKTVRGRRGETNFAFHTSLVDANGNTLDLTEIDFVNCNARIWVRLRGSTDAPIINNKQMVAHPRQDLFPNHIVYFATAGEMASPAGDYDWEIVFTDFAGNVTTYPKDSDDGYGLFRMLPTLAS